MHHSQQVQNVAYPADPSDPILRKWSKPDYNPIIFPDKVVNASEFRDPSTAWYGPDGSSYKQHIYRPTFASFVDINIAKAKQIALRTLIDHSVVESFGAHGRTCILSRSYPKYAVGHDAHLFVFNNGESEIQVTKLMPGR